MTTRSPRHPRTRVLAASIHFAVVSATGASLALRPTTWMSPSDGGVQGSSFALEMCTEHGSVLETASISSIPSAAPSAPLSSPAL